MQNISLKSLQQLIQMITPRKGVKRKAIANDEKPEDEGE